MSQEDEPRFELPDDVLCSISGGTLKRLRKVAAKVREALSQQGDDVCWRDLYNPEVAELVGVEFDPQLLPEPQFIGNCVHFRRCLGSDTYYETPAPSPEVVADGVIGILAGMSLEERGRFYDRLLSQNCTYCGLPWTDGTRPHAYCPNCGAS